MCALQLSCGSQYTRKRGVYKTAPPFVYVLYNLYYLFYLYSLYNRTLPSRTHNAAIRMNRSTFYVTSSVTEIRRLTLISYIWLTLNHDLEMSMGKPLAETCKLSTLGRATCICHILGEYNNIYTLRFQF